MKWLSAVNLPVSCCTPLISVGSCILAIAWTFSGFASIPREETMYPRSFPAGTPNTHFFGLSLILYLLSAAKVSQRSSSSVLALCFDDDVVDVDLNVSVDLVSQTCLHHPLVRGSGVFKTEGHCSVAEYAIGVMNEVCSSSSSFMLI